MTILYVFDENGKYPSCDGSKHYSRYEGDEAYAIMTAEENQNKFFSLISDSEDDDRIWQEIENKYKQDILQEKRRNQYMSDCLKNSDIEFVSLYERIPSCEGKEPSTWLEVVADETVNIEQEVQKKEGKYRLKKALESLTEEEREFLNLLYLGENVLSLHEFGSLNHTTRQAVNSRKNVIFNKIKIFLKI